MAYDLKNYIDNTGPVKCVEFKITFPLGFDEMATHILSSNIDVVEDLRDANLEDATASITEWFSRNFPTRFAVAQSVKKSITADGCVTPSYRLGDTRHGNDLLGVVEQLLIGVWNA